MIGNYFLIAVRNLIKQKGYSAINVIGLAIGMSACLLILMYVLDELSYDRFRPDADRLYRAVLKARINEKELEAPISAGPMASTLMREMPEVESAARLRASGNFIVRYGERSFTEKKFFFADSNFLQVLSISLVAGDPHTALTGPFSLVLTADMARKYFGDENAMGRTVEVDGEHNYKVTGIAESMPHNSHFKFDFLASRASRIFGDENIWLSNNDYTYVLFRPGHEPAEIAEKLQRIVVNGAGPMMQQVFGVSFEDWEAAGGRYAYYFQKVTDVHLHSNLHHELEPNGNILYVYVFSMIAVFILLLACINFMNLSTARSSRRAKEVGVRKALGSRYIQLVQLFLTESVLITLAALGLALISIELVLPFFNQFTGKEIELPYFSEPVFVPALVCFAVVVGVLAGAYPAFLLSAFSPVKVLKGEFRSGPRRSMLRSSLVVFQFAISVILIVGTFVVYKQLDYMQQKDLGFKKDNVLVIDNTWLLSGTHERFKEALRRIPGVLHAGYASTLPGLYLGNSAYVPEGGDPRNPVLLWHMWVDYDVLPALDVRFSEGRNYSPDFPADSTTGVIVNKAALPFLGFQEGAGKVIKTAFGRGSMTMTPLTIVGVTEDFHFMSLHESIRPLAIRYGVERNRNLAVLRVQTDDWGAFLSKAQDAWNEAAGSAPFEYFFLDDKFDALYKSEQTIGSTLLMFSCLGIFVACLGLFGLSNFAAEQRTKEIGIRKVMGASVFDIVGLLSREFLALVALANLLGWPIAYLMMQGWLENFAYRTDLTWTIFALTGLLALAIALLTVGFKALRTARMNPVGSLRYE